MDGVELIQILKNNPNFNTPIVALTADAMNGARKKYLSVFSCKCFSTIGEVLELEKDTFYKHYPMKKYSLWIISIHYISSRVIVI